MILIPLIKVDLKGLPSFMMSQVLKRYPLLLNYIRQYFMSPRIPSPTNIELNVSISSTWSLESTQSVFKPSKYEDAIPCQHYIHQNTSDLKDGQ